MRAPGALRLGGAAWAPGRVAHVVLPFAVLALSFSAIFVRWSESPPQELAALRLALSAAILVPFAARRKALRSFAPKTLLLASLSGLALGVHYIVWFDSLRYTSVASSTLLVTLHPLLVVPASYLLWGRRTTAPGVLGIAAALAGGALIAGGDLSIDAAHLRGDAEALLAAMAMGTYLLIGSTVRRSVGLAPYTAVVYGVGGAFALAAAAMDGMAWPVAVREWLVVAGLVLVPSLVGHTAFNWSLRHVAPAMVSVSILGEPVGSIALAALLFGETPTAWQVLGGAVLLAGICVFAWFGTPRGREQT